MLNIESRLWKVATHNDVMAYILQKASGETRYLHPSLLPSELATVSEKRFDAILRELFNNAARR